MTYSDDTRTLRAHAEKMLRDCDDDMTEEEEKMAQQIMRESDDFDWRQGRIG